MNLVVLALTAPLAGFVINGLFGKKLPKQLVGILASGAILVSFIAAILLFLQLKTSPEAINSKLYTFLKSGDFTIEFGFMVDRLTSVMMLVITGVGFLIHLYSISYMHDDKGFYKFFAYLNLFVFNMLVLVMGSNFLMLFFGWEGVGLCSYLLIGFWYNNVEYGKAARKAFIMNRIGDLGLLLALFLLLTNFHSLDYKTVFTAVMEHPEQHGVLTVIGILLFIGAMGKSAQLPLYTWLPDAMAGPTPVSALIHAATMVTAGIYLVVRCQSIYFYAPIARELIMWVGLATSIFAAVIGLKQNDIKKVLAYSTVSQLGLMFVALGCMSYTAAMFHLITHAFFKALLFLGSGSVIHAMGGEQDIRKMGGLKKHMPITYITFIIGTLAICGFPLFSGFFSKDEILTGAFSHNKVVWILSLLSAMITSIYMLRLVWVTFFGKFRGTHDQEHHLHESPALMTTPLVILAILSLIGGLINLPSIVSTSMGHGLGHWLEKTVVENPKITEIEISHSTELILAGLAFLVFILAFIYTRNKYISKATVPEADEAMSGAGLVVANKFYVDETYDAAFVQPLEHTGNLMTSLDEEVLNKGYSSTGKAVSWIGKMYGKLQNGNVEYYLLYMVVAIIIMFVVNMFNK